jgi:hypothetical protein
VAEVQGKHQLLEQEAAKRFRHPAQAQEKVKFTVQEMVSVMLEGGLAGAQCCKKENAVCKLLYANDVGRVTR